MIYRKQGHVGRVTIRRDAPKLTRPLLSPIASMRIDGQNPKVLMERAIEIQVLAITLDVAGDRKRSAAMFRQALDLVQAVAQRDPSYKNIRERIAKVKVQLGFQLARTADLEGSQKQIEAGIADYEALVKGAGGPTRCATWRHQDSGSDSSRRFGVTWMAQKRASKWRAMP